MFDVTEAFKDLGWVNGWSETPEIVKKCRELNHDTTDTDEGRIKYRGYDTVTRCATCGYKYHCDSSD